MISEIQAVVNVLHASYSKSDKIKAYAFGSALTTGAIPNDIDILITYEDPAMPKKIRNILRDVGYLPIHLLFLTPEEEEETAFVSKQQCKLIYEPQ